MAVTRPDLVTYVERFTYSYLASFIVDEQTTEPAFK
jgi:hypothetical protein